jgi:hypothetical protein
MKYLPMPEKAIFFGDTESAFTPDHLARQRIA